MFRLFLSSTWLFWNATAVMIESSDDGSFLRNDIPLPLDTLEGKTTGLLIVPWFVLGERTRQTRFMISVGYFQTKYRPLRCHWPGSSLSPFFVSRRSAGICALCTEHGVITIFTPSGNRWWPGGESLRSKLLPQPSFGPTAKLLPRGQSRQRAPSQFP